MLLFPCSGMFSDARCVYCAPAICFVSSLDVESKTLQGVKGELLLDKSGQHHLENTTLDFQKLSDKEVLRITGPLGADFTVKVRANSGSVCYV